MPTIEERAVKFDVKLVEWSGKDIDIETWHQWVQEYFALQCVEVAAEAYEDAKAAVRELSGEHRQTNKAALLLYPPLKRNSPV